MISKDVLVQKYLSGYPTAIKDSVNRLIEDGLLGTYLNEKYPEHHQIVSDASLRKYATDIKNHYMRQSAPLSKVLFDDKIHVVRNALGAHSYVSRVQGSKLKSKNELRVSSLFKQAPPEFLNMIVVHELAHLKEKEHNKAFYRLCEHMLPQYHQLELDTRLFLIKRESMRKNLQA